MSAVDKCQLLRCVLLLWWKHDWCVAITSSLDGLSAVAMLCVNVCGLSYVTVSNLSPSIRSCTMSSNMCVKCAYYLSSKIGFATYAFFPFGKTILNLAFPKMIG